MISSFNYDEKSAKRNDAPMSITENGAYIVKICQVSVFDSKSGATFIRFSVKDEETDAVAHPQMCIKTSRGEDTFQVQIINALMALVGATNAPIIAGAVYSPKGEKSQGYRMPALENHRIGVVLQKEWRNYTDQEGHMRDTFSMNLITFFDPDTRQVASEAIERREAKLLDQRLKNLKDKFAKDFVSHAAGNDFESAPRQQTQAQTQADDIDNFF